MSKTFVAAHGLIGALLLALLVGLLAACHPETTAPQPARPVDAVVALPDAGAWTAADPFDAEIQEAARFAVQTFAVQNQRRILYKDVSLARQQVVAGRQFELHLQLSLDGAKREAKATVWQQTSGRYKLTDWVWQD